jgi:hypothetical protein
MSFPLKWLFLRPNFAALTWLCLFAQDVITSQSSYLRRHLLDSSDVVVTLPAGLTLAAFADAIASCYGADVTLSPATLAPAWAAAGWLGMSKEDYDGLARTAEDYFQKVATDRSGAAEVLQSCAAFLGGEAAGPATELLARCLEALAASDLSSGGGKWLDDVAALPVEEFLVVVEALRARFVHDPDLLYTVVDRYLEVRRPSLLPAYLHRSFLNFESDLGTVYSERKDFTSWARICCCGQLHYPIARIRRAKLVDHTAVPVLLSRLIGKQHSSHITKPR